MTELEKRKGELALLQESVNGFHESLFSKDYVLKDLRDLSRSQARKLEVLEHNITVLENDSKLLKASHDKAMDKVIRVDRLLTKKPNVVVPKDIVVDVLSASGSNDFL